jgi:2-phospho-L-lactate/phosphoenolpyruvate guanylyltransferase
LTPMILVPVKRLDLAKSRIALPAEDRRWVACVLALHTLSTAAAAVGGDSLTVVTADHEVSEAASALGAHVVDETFHDLNSALEQGLDEVALAWPTRPVAVLVSALPHVTRRDIQWLARVCCSSRGSGHVADMTGTGTTALVLSSGERPLMAFGPGSAQRFRSAGCAPLSTAPAGLRTDLDTVDDLHRLGIPAA